MGKRWRVDVYFKSPEIGLTLVESREFTFWLIAKWFAHDRDQWSNWRFTRPVIVDQRKSPA